MSGIASDPERHVVDGGPLSGLVADAASLPELLDALEQLEGLAAGPVDLVAAACTIALPVSFEARGELSVTPADGRVQLSWRGAVTSVREIPDREEVAVAVAALIHAGARPGDRFPALVGHPAGWCLLSRSGVWAQLRGLTALGAGVAVQASPELPAAAIREVVTQLWGAAPSGPTVIEAAGVTVAVDPLSTTVPIVRLHSLDQVPAADASSAGRQGGSHDPAADMERTLAAALRLSVDLGVMVQVRTGASGALLVARGGSWCFEVPVGPGGQLGLDDVEVVEGVAALSAADAADFGALHLVGQDRQGRPVAESPSGILGYLTSSRS